jgi:hypothetical protein
MSFQVRMFWDGFQPHPAAAVSYEQAIIDLTASRLSCPTRSHPTVRDSSSRTAFTP